MNLRRALGGGVVALLCAAGAALGAEVTIDDSVPGEITISHDANFDFGVNNMGMVYPSFDPGSEMTTDEFANFVGDFQSFQPAMLNMGVIYFVDPDDPDTVLARIEGSWPSNTGHVYTSLQFFSSPEGGNLGALPPAFAGLGVPLPETQIAVQNLFRDSVTVQPSKPPGTLTIIFIGEGAAPCPGDVSGDDMVDGVDLASILASWGPCSGCPEDITGDGVVNGEDLAAMLAGWGGCD